MINTYVSLDLETTGLNPKLDKIIEIGAVKVDNGVIIDRFSTYVNPGVVLNEHTISLTGITQDIVNSAPSIQEVLSLLLDFLGELPLVGHKILFDYSFVKKACVDAKLSFERKGIDTLRLSRACLLELPKKTLGAVCEYYKIPIEAHRAYSDAQATAQVYEKLKEQFVDTYPELFVPIPLQFKVKKDSKATTAQKEQLTRLASQHEICLQVDLELLSRSEASRLIGEILQAYGR